MAQNPFAGDYLGALEINGQSSGRLLLIVDGAGGLTEAGNQLSGSVDAAGGITFDPNDFGFASASIDQNFAFEVTGSANSLNYRLVARQGAGAFSAGSLDEVFERTNPANFFSDATDVIWDGARFVAITGQSVAVSSDGQNWETRSTGLNAVFERIAYGNGTYVLVGESDAIATSADLMSFTLRSSGLGLPAFNLVDVVYFNNRFYAANINNAYISSADGIGWTRETAPFVATFQGGIGRLDALNGELVISWQEAGAFTDIVFYTSADGTTFSGPSESVNVGHETLAQAYGDGVYLSAATGGIARSTNGSTWSKVSGLPATTARSLAFAGGRFVANFLNDRWYYSSDGQSWTEANGAETEALALASNGAIAVGVGDEPFYSDDAGANWNSAVVDQLELPDSFFNADFEVQAGNGRFLFTYPTAPSFVSTDARTFAPTGQRLTHAAYGNGVFVGYDDEDGRLEYSIDGLEWFAVPVPAGAEGVLGAAGGVIFTGDHFYRPGWISENGIEWTELPGYSAPSLSGGRPGLVERLTDAVASPDTNEFWLRGFTKTFWFSLDGGRTFDSQTYGLRQYPHVAYGNGVWVMAGPSGYYRVGESLASTTEFRYEDGVERPNFLSMSFIDGVFYATIEDNRVLLSVDGEHWTQKTFGANVTLIDGASNGAIGVLTGREATVFATDLGQSLTPPAIMSQPQDTNVDEGGRLTLGATVAHAQSASFLWTLNGRPLRNGDGISGADTASLTIAGMRADQAGEYRLIVRAPSGAGAISTPAAVTVNPLPVFTTQPMSATGFSGQSVTLTGAVEDATATLQWRKNGVDLPGETAATLELTSMTEADAAIYTLVATNAVGSRESAPAAVSVNILASGGLSPDAAFMGNAPTDFQGGFVSAVAAQSDGKILVGAKYDDGSGFEPHLVRLNTDGTRDTTFTPPDVFNGEIRAIIEDDHGRIFTGGTHRSPMSLRALDQEGNLMEEFDTTGPRFSVFDLFIDGDYLYVIGDFVVFEGAAAGGATRINLNTLSVDADYQENADDGIDGLFYAGALQSDGKLVVMGNQGFRTFRRLNVDGSGDNSFANPFISTSDYFAIDGQDNIHLRRSKYDPDGDEIDGFLSSGFAALEYLGNDVLLSYSDRPIAVSALDGGILAEPDFGSDPAGPFISDIYAVGRNGDDFLFAGQFDTFLGASANNLAYISASSGGSPVLTIARQPQDVTAREGETAVFAVAASGAGVTFRWRKDGDDLPGETGTSLTIANVSGASAGDYDVVVTDGENNELMSAAATLTVPGTQPSGVTFMQWASQNLPGDGWTLDGDANNNGYADALDFVFAVGTLPPRVRVEQGMDIGAGDGKRYMTYQIHQRRNLSGIAVTPKAATTLEGLSSGGSNVVVVGVEEDGDFDIVTYRATFAIDDTETGFMTIQVAEE